MNANKVTITANNGTNNNDNNNASTGDSTSPVAGNSGTPPEYDPLNPFEEKPRDMCLYIRRLSEWQKQMLRDFGHEERDLYLTPEFFELEHLCPESFEETFENEHRVFFEGRYIYKDALKSRQIATEIRKLRAMVSAETDPEVKTKLDAEIETLNRSKSKLRDDYWIEEMEFDGICPDLLWHADKAKKVYEQAVEAAAQVAEIPCQEWIMEQSPRDPDFYTNMAAVSKDRGLCRISGFLSLVLQTELGASLKIHVNFNNDQVARIYQFLKRYSENHGQRVNIFGFPGHEFTETTLNVRVTSTQIDPDNMTPIEVLLRNMIRDGRTSYTIEFPNREKCVGRVMHFTSEWFNKRGLEGFCTMEKTYSDDKEIARLTFNMEDYEDYEEFVFNEEKDEYEIPIPLCKYGSDCGLFGCTARHPEGFVSRARPPRAPRAEAPLPLFTGGGSARNTTRAEPPLLTGGGSAMNTTRALPEPALVPAPTYTKIGGGSGTRTWNPVAVETDAPVAIDMTRASKAQERLAAIDNTRVEQERLAAIVNTRVEQKPTIPKYCLQEGEVPPPVWDFSPKSVCMFANTCTNSRCTYVHLTERRKSDNTIFRGCNCAETTQCTVQNCHLWHGTPSVPVAVEPPVCIMSGFMPPMVTGKVRICRFGEKSDGSGCTNQKCTNIHRFHRFKSGGEPVWFNEVCSLGLGCTRPDCQWLHPRA
jgi:hypothetical protein